MNPVVTDRCWFSQNITHVQARTRPCRYLGPVCKIVAAFFSGRIICVAQGLTSNMWKMTPLEDSKAGIELHLPSSTALQTPPAPPVHLCAAYTTLPPYCCVAVMHQNPWFCQATVFTWNRTACIPFQLQYNTEEKNGSPNPPFPLSTSIIHCSLVSWHLCGSVGHTAFWIRHTHIRSNPEDQYTTLSRSCKNRSRYNLVINFRIRWPISKITVLCTL